MDDFSPARTRRTFEVIGDQIREQVRSGAIKSGDKLPPERTLAEQFGTSRNAVREALRALEHAGLISLQKGAHGGAFITDGNPEAVAQSIEDLLHLSGVELRDITDARLLIETSIVEAAVARATEADLDRMQKNIDMVEELTRNGEMEAKTELNIGFHILLAECTGNPVLILLMRVLMDLLRQVHFPISANDTAGVVDSRRRFLARLRSRDAAGAADEMSEHLTHLHQLFTKV
ncbi:MAG: HTH-type transcriptional regulator LutR [Alphaproteobacteria bacterium MarineAlpha11_Bin1]|nr:MAG: HTH-type transcriptional regulator LutR [Alphaproteobacteria bacterium MarineAlpha11_Bin1]|tara:strand:- start:2663 stop:3361 length:699 start_codon:yes stop_codon:yes gene_type:complete